MREQSKRASGAGVEVLFVEGTVTTLTDTGIGSGFHLFLDFGAVHSLQARAGASGKPWGYGGGRRGRHASDVRVLAGSQRASAARHQSGGDRTSL